VTNSVANPLDIELNFQFCPVLDSYDIWIKMFQFYACICCRELPINLSYFVVCCRLPVCQFGLHIFFIGEPVIQAPAILGDEFNFCHVQPYEISATYLPYDTHSLVHNFPKVLHRLLPLDRIYQLLIQQRQ
jgi:hypothetical protein